MHFNEYRPLDTTANILGIPFMSAARQWDMKTYITLCRLVPGVGTTTGEANTLGPWYCHCSLPGMSVARVDVDCRCAVCYYGTRTIVSKVYCNSASRHAGTMV